MFQLNSLRTIFDTIYGQVTLSILNQNINIPTNKIILIYFFFFNFILLANGFGIISFSQTITASFIITLFLSLSLFITIHIIGGYFNKGSLLRNILPSNIPLLILPFLIIIELISYIARIFSIAIRLFANMMAGHALLKILTGFSWIILLTSPFGISFFPGLIVTIIFALEAIIAFLQTYIFIVLFALYFSDIQ